MFGIHRVTSVLCALALVASACDDGTDGEDSGVLADSSVVDGGGEDDGATGCAAPELPTEGPGLSLTAAGAPAALFGPASAPTFREGYASLRDAGFTRHFPFFGTREIVDPPEGDTTPPTSSGHERYFFDATCEGGVAFLAAQDAGMELLFPAFFFFPEGESEAFDRAAFRARFESYQRSCFGEAEGVITGYYNYDEMSSNWAGIELVNRGFGMSNPLPPIPNAAALAAATRELTDTPVYAIDGPAGPLLERDRVAIEGAGVDLDALLADYDTQLRMFAGSADVFGFDAYPIPESYWFPVTTSGDLVGVARGVAPADARIVSVLQGMSFDAQGGHTGIGATGPTPTLAETRFLAYDAVVAGAEELIWYGPNFLDLDRPADAAFWADLLSVVGELRTLGPALAGPRRALEVAEDSVAAAAFQIPDSELLVVVNRARTTVTATVPLPDRAQLVRWPDGGVEPSADVPLGPLEVALFLTSICD